MSTCSGPTVSSYDRLRAAVNQAAENGIFLLRDVGQGASRSNIVVLVGEHRASVARQRELVTLLDMLVETNAISAILVERPSGPIATMGVRHVLELALAVHGSRTCHACSNRSVADGITFRRPSPASEAVNH